MARVKELESTLKEYAGICSELVSGYYEKFELFSYGQVPRGVQCEYKISHGYSICHGNRGVKKIQKEFDSACIFCRKRIGENADRIEAVNAIRKFDKFFIELYDLEHDTKVAKIIKKHERLLPYEAMPQALLALKRKRNPREEMIETFSEN